MMTSPFATHAEREQLAELIWHDAKMNADEDKCDLDVDELPENHLVWRAADLILEKYYVIVREKY